MSQSGKSYYEYDYSQLYRQIKKLYKTQAAFAKALGIGRTSLNLKLNNNVEFTQNEIYVGAKLLGIEVEEIPDYFFRVAGEK